MVIYMFLKSTALLGLFVFVLGQPAKAADSHLDQLKKVATEISKKFEGKKLLLLGESTHLEPEFLELLEQLADVNSETIDFIVFEKLRMFKETILEAAEKDGKTPEAVLALPEYYQQTFQFHLA